MDPLTGKQEQDERPQTFSLVMCEKKRISFFLKLSGDPCPRPHPLHHSPTPQVPECQWLPEQAASERSLKVPSQQQPCLALMYAEFIANPLLQSVSRARLLCTWRPPPCCLCGFLWRTVAGHWGPVLDHPSSISDTTGWQSTYSHSLMNIQFTPASFKGTKDTAYLNTGERKVASLSLPLPLLILFVSLYTSTT